MSWLLSIKWSHTEISSFDRDESTRAVKWGDSGTEKLPRMVYDERQYGHHNSLYIQTKSGYHPRSRSFNVYDLPTLSFNILLFEFGTL